MKRVDVRKSTIYTSDYDSASSCMRRGYMGERGFFTNEGDCMMDTSLCEGTLEQVIYEKHTIYYCNHIGNFKFFIPEGKLVYIEEEPKKLRPFKNIDEFSNETGCEVVGDDFITIRNKNTQKEYVLLYIGYSDEEVHLGGYVFTFADLLKNYEFSYNDEWCPFGIEE